MMQQGVGLAQTPGCVTPAAGRLPIFAAQCLHGSLGGAHLGADPVVLGMCLGSASYLARIRIDGGAQPAGLTGLTD